MIKNSFKKAIQALLRRVFGPLFFALLLTAAGSGCAFSARTIGQHDPTVEAIKALTEVLKAHPAQPLGAPPAPSPSPTGTPQERIESQASGAWIRMENLHTVEASPEGGR